MPWKERSEMTLKQELVHFARAEGANISQLCARFGVSRKTAYKWLARYAAEGEAGLTSRSRRPHHSPRKTAHAVEKQLLDLRTAHPAWGARKLKARLETRDQCQLPAVSTLHAILKRNDQIDPVESLKHQAFIRFEHPEPNDLLQMDFKGHFKLGDGTLCHPLTVIDDHSRFNLVLAACDNQRKETVQHHLIQAFRRYGLPKRMTMDNGSPWGDDADSPHTRLTVWLMRLGIKISHSRPYHPQTQGKDERFHRTLDVELLRYNHWSMLDQVHPSFDTWRDIYNTERPHESAQMRPPMSRYTPSPRPYPEVLPAIEYDTDDQVIIVDKGGRIWLNKHSYKIGKPYIGLPVAVRHTLQSDIKHVFFMNHHARTLNLSQQTSSFDKP